MRKNSGTYVASEHFNIALSNSKWHCKHYAAFILRNRMINTGRFAEVLNDFSDHACLSYFRFTKADVQILVQIICSKPADGYFTENNRYSCDPILSFCVLLS